MQQAWIDFFNKLRRGDEPDDDGTKRIVEAVSNGGRIPPPPHSWWDKYPNFAEHELACKCCGACEVKEGLVAALQALRDAYGKPIKINSGFRCPKHNAEVGGAAHSKHLEGIAADIAVPDCREMRILIRLATDFNGLGVGGTFIHLDIRPDPAVWTY